MKVLPKALIVAIALAIITAACSSSDSADTTTTSFADLTTSSEATTSTEATTTTTSTTTTTTLPPGIEPTINGLPGEEGTQDRRVISVKIDNHPSARPQSGIELADAAYEVLVEGGLTRFIALFQQSDTDYLGPNRSGRPTDSALMASLDGAFQISGAQPWIQNIFVRDGVHVVYDNGATTYRTSHRSAPHNLYTSTPDIRVYADARGWPDTPPAPLFVYGNEPTEAIESAEAITFNWSNQPDIVWKWDGEQYLRFNGDVAHQWINRDAESGQIAFDMLVVMKADQYIAKDPTGQGSSVPAMTTTGSGEALVFHSGGVFEAIWERETVQEMIRVVDEDGNDVILPPGRVWINVFPDDRTITWE